MTPKSEWIDIIAVILENANIHFGWGWNDSQPSNLGQPHFYMEYVTFKNYRIEHSFLSGKIRINKKFEDGWDTISSFDVPQTISNPNENGVAFLESELRKIIT